MIVMIGILWGLNWPVVKFMLSEMPPLTIRAAAFPLAALLLALIARMAGHALRPSKSDVVPIVLTGLFLVFGFNVLTTFGQLMTETSRAAIIAYTMPALTAVLAVVFLRERLAWRIMAALVIGMAALAVLISEDVGAVASGPEGPTIMLLAALSWSLGNVALKSRSWSLSPLALTVWFFVVSSLACWPLMLMFEPPVAADMAIRTGPSRARLSRAWAYGHLLCALDFGARQAFGDDSGNCDADRADRRCRICRDFSGRAGDLREASSAFDGRGLDRHYALAEVGAGETTRMSLDQQAAHAVPLSPQWEQRP